MEKHYAETHHVQDLEALMKNHKLQLITSSADQEERNRKKHCLCLKHNTKVPPAEKFTVQLFAHNTKFVNVHSLEKRTIRHIQLYNQ